MASFPKSQNNSTVSMNGQLSAYAELHCLSNFTFLRGASHPEELVSEAARLGYKALAITDECSLSGIVRAHQQAKQENIQLLIGSEFKLGKNTTLIILATHRQSYGQLSALITHCRRHAEKGHYQIHLEDIKRFIREAVFIILPDYRNPDATLLETLSHFYNDSLWIGLNLHHHADEALKKQRLYQLAKQFHCPLVACGSVLMHKASQQMLQDTLTAIRQNQSIYQLGFDLESNAEHHLRPLETLQNIYPPETLAETQHIQNRCHFSLDELRYEYPAEVVPPGKDATQYLRELVMQGARQRWPKGIPDKVHKLLDKELILIKKLHYEYYFLTVYDIVQFARSENILCQGRGSAANSAVCFCLYITEVDPALNDLLIERFISEERNEPPDIDVDFEHQRREEVIQFIYKKYGRDRAALAATVITYRTKSAIRDVGKALGLDLSQVEQMSKAFAWWDRRAEYLTRLQESGINTNTPTMQHFVQLVERILGFPRHLSQHVGGFIISQGPLSQLVPIENASMVDRTIIQWDKNDLEALGLMKVDILALGILTAIRKCFTYLHTLRGQQWSMATLPAEDPKVYQMLQNGDSTGLFQVESRAQMAMLPRLKPVTFYDLVIQVAIVRPGPIQGKMVHPYLKRRQGLETVHYANDDIKQVLERTLGVPIFQEQVIKLAMVAAGFSAGEADQLRRAMARWKKTGELKPFQEKLKKGMQERHYPETFAEQICQQIQGFGEYGFPESHAASFALLVYVTAWLKCYEPAAYCCALLNSQPMGFYSPSQLVQDAKRHHVQVFDVDVNKSQWEHHLEYETLQPASTLSPQQQPAIRLGFSLIKGLKKQSIDKLLQARHKKIFSNLQDLLDRTQLSPAEMETLTRGGALTVLSGNRHQSRWQIQGMEPSRPLLNEKLLQDDAITLPAPSTGQEVMEDYRHLGLSLKQHPIALLRHHPELRHCKLAAQLTELGHRRFVQIAGIVTGRQRPATATGVVFITLEDESGNSNVVVWKNLVERQRATLLGARLLKVKGVVERDKKVIHVIAGELIDLSHLLGDLSLASRDFH